VSLAIELDLIQPVLPFRDSPPPMDHGIGSKMGVCKDKLPTVDSEDQRERLQATASHSTLPLTSLVHGPKRLREESARAYRAFRGYLNLGPRRSLDQAWQFFRAGSGGKAPTSARRPGHWSRWCARYQWVARAAAYDQFLAAPRLKAEDDRKQLVEQANRELLKGEQRGHSAIPGQAGDTTGRRGRPSIISDQLLEQFCKFVAMTGSIETAIQLTAIGRGTYYRWQSRVRKGEGSPFQTKFILAAEAACVDTKMRNENLFLKKMEKDWRAIAFWLSRKYPKEYGRPRTIRLSADEGDDRLKAPGAARIKVEPVTPIAEPADASAAVPLESVDQISAAWVSDSYYETLGFGADHGPLAHQR
jgi:hypothetical protein